MISTKDAPRIKNDVREATEDMKDNLRAAAQDTGRRIRGFLDSAGDSVQDATDKVTTQIRSNPIQSSVIALGAGILIGALLRR